MKVFLAGIIQGSLVEPRIHDQDWRRAIRRAVERALPSARVYCHYARHPGSITYGLAKIRSTLAEGLARAAECDLLVAYVPEASMGTALEMYEARRHGAVVLTISPLVANWIVRAYSHRVFPDVESFEAFLAGQRARKMLRSRRRSPSGRSRGGRS